MSKELREQLKIIQEGRGWLAAYKPAYMTVHNEPGHDAVSSLKALCGRDCLPVNRLDKGTSGIILFAKDAASAAALGRVFAEGKSNKWYLALIHGCLQDAQGTWSKPLSREAEGRKNPAGLSKNRVPAVTNWQVLQRAERWTLLAVELITGRKHQIRRHAALAGFPLLGDQRYGHNRASAPRLGLHSHRLAFTDPDTREPVTCEVDAPEDFWSLTGSPSQVPSSEGC